MDNLNFRGIVRATSPQDNADGNCAEIINLRPREGVWRAVGPKETVIEDSRYEQVYSHRYGSFENLIGVEPYRNIPYEDPEFGQGYPVVWVIPGSIWGNRQLCIARTFPSFAQLNNILLVRDDYNIYKLVFSNGAYSAYSYQLPTLPVIATKPAYAESNPGGEIEQKIRHTSSVKDGVPCNINPDGPITYTEGNPHAWRRTFEADDLNTLADAIRGAYNKAKTSKPGFTTGYVFLSVAYQLFDGSVTKPSPPQLLYLGNEYKPDLFYFTHIYDGDPSITIKGKIPIITLYKLKVSLSGLPDYQKYKDIVRKVNVYATSPIDIYDWANLAPAYLHYTVADKMQRYNLTGTADRTEGLPEKVLRTPDVEGLLFYRVAQFDLNGAGEQEVDFTDITTRPTLPVDSSGWINTSGNMLVYNNRLHLYNLRETLADMSLLNKQWSTGGDVTLTAATYIKCATQDMVVLTRFTTLARPGGGYYLPGFISFPDSRAYKTDIFGPDGQQPLAYRCLLEPSTAYNYAFGFPDGSALIGDSKVKLPEECNSNTDGMKLIVSEAANPYYFPPRHSYLIAGEILNIGINTEQVSASQVGQYPLYIFTVEGIYALQTGEGTVLYSNLIPISAETAVRGSSILQTRFGILFVTDKGLRLINGQEVAGLSEPLDGLPDSERLYGNEACRLLASHASLCNILPHLSRVSFREYSREAVMGYDSRHDEIIVSNSTYPYSYVYSLEYKSWHKITEVFAGFNRTTGLRTTSPGRKAAKGSVEIVEAGKEFRFRHYAQIDLAYSGYDLEAGDLLEALLIDASGQAHRRFGHTLTAPMNILDAAPLLSAPAEGLRTGTRGRWVDFALIDSLAGNTVSVSIALNGEVIRNSGIIQSPYYTAESSLTGQKLTLEAGEYSLTYVIQPADIGPVLLAKALAGIDYPWKTVQGNKIIFSSLPGSAGNNTRLRLEAPDCPGLEIIVTPFAGGGDANLSVCDINSETETTLPVHLHTRPLAGGFYGFKKLRRMMMRGEFRPAEGKWWHASLFGSNDLTAWHRVASCFLPAAAPQLQLPEVAATYRYFILMAGGEARPGHVVGHAEWEVESRYDGRIR